MKLLAGMQVGPRGGRGRGYENDLNKLQKLQKANVKQEKKEAHTKLTEMQHTLMSAVCMIPSRNNTKQARNVQHLLKPTENRSASI